MYNYYCEVTNTGKLTYDLNSDLFKDNKHQLVFNDWWFVKSDIACFKPTANIPMDNSTTVNHDQYMVNCNQMD